MIAAPPGTALVGPFVQLGERVQSLTSSFDYACWESCVVSQGTIKKLTDRGFGFIQGERGELFFHHSSVEGVPFESLREGQTVEYSEGQGPKGPRAENIKVLN